MKKSFLNIFAIVFLALFARADGFSFNDMTLKFAHISDVHLSDRTQDTSYKALTQSGLLLRDAIRQVNMQKNLDFVMFGGDFVDTPSEKLYLEFYKYANTLNTPYYLTLGNHDIAQDSKGMSKQKFVLFNNSHNPNSNFTKTYYSFSPKPDFKVIVLDLMIDSEISANGMISPEQLKWLDEELNNSKDKVVLIFQHFPVVEPIPSEDHKVLNTGEYLKIIEKYKMPIAIFAGHYHMTKLTRVGNIIHVNTPSLITYPNAFRLVSITNYKDKTIFDFYFKETAAKDVQQKCKSTTIAPQSFYGADKDRQTTFVINKKHE